MPRLPHPPGTDNSNYTWRRVEIIGEMLESEGGREISTRRRKTEGWVWGGGGELSGGMRIENEIDIFVRVVCICDDMCQKD
jgi:hypothetical protein